MHQHPNFTSTLGQHPGRGCHCDYEPSYGPSFEALALGGEVFKLGIFEDFTINGAWCDIDNVDATTNVDRMGQFICESII